MTWAQWFKNFVLPDIKKQGQELWVKEKAWRKEHSGWNDSAHPDCYWLLRQRLWTARDGYGVAGKG